MQIIYTNASVSKLQYAKSDKNIPESVTEQYDKNKGPKKQKRSQIYGRKSYFHISKKTTKICT